MDNLLINSCVQFCQNFQEIDLSSITDYVPNELQEKIFDDIKQKGLENSFILEYNLETFKKYVTKQNFKYYDEFMNKFKGTNDLNFTILILNWSIFNEQKISKELNEVDQQILQQVNKLFNDKTELSIKDNFTILQSLKLKANKLYSDVYKNNINHTDGDKLYNSLKSQLSRTIFNQLMQMFYQNNCNFVFQSMDNNRDQKISKIEVINYMKLLRLNEFQESKQLDQNTCGFCLNLKSNFKTIDGFAYFINKDIMQQSDEPLHEVYDLINHEIDHYFETSLNTPENTILKQQADMVDPADKKVIDSINTNIYTDKQFLYYLFERSQFNSRCTDVCNFLLTTICPILGNQSLNSFYDAINNIIKYDNLGIMKVIKYPWFKYTQKIMAIIAFSAVTQKLFPQTKWQVLKDRLEHDFDQYENLSEQNKQIYAQEIKNKFSK